MTFESLELMPAILQALQKEGYQKPTPIQAQTVPLILAGKDILGCAQTGTGKTAAFAMPLLQMISQSSPGRQTRPHPLALVLTPTRELAIQIQESFQAYGRYIPQVRHTVIFGGVSQKPQEIALKKGVDILVATPGRLLDLIQQGIVRLEHLRYFVLDEADRMLDMGFIHDIRKIIRLLPRTRQTLFFSATMPPDIARLAQNILSQPVEVAVTPVSSTVDTIAQSVYPVQGSEKMKLLVHILQHLEYDRVLVFSRTKHGANRISRQLETAGISCAAIHGNKSQNARQQALQGFKERRLKVLVATDIASRGIDVDQLSHVINFDLPEVAETYVHRIGRTGRAGASGTALTFCAPEETAYLKGIERLTGRTIELVTGHPFYQTVSAPAAVRPQTQTGQRTGYAARQNRPRRTSLSSRYR